MSLADCFVVIAVSVFTALVSEGLLLYVQHGGLACGVPPRFPGAASGIVSRATAATPLRCRRAVVAARVPLGDVPTTDRDDRAPAKAKCVAVLCGVAVAAGQHCVASATRLARNHGCRCGCSTCNCGASARTVTCTAVFVLLWVR
jgi:hypothetical protein